MGNILVKRADTETWISVSADSPDDSYWRKSRARQAPQAAFYRQHSAGRLKLAQVEHRADRAGRYPSCGDFKRGELGSSIEAAGFHTSAYNGRRDTRLP